MEPRPNHHLQFLSGPSNRLPVAFGCFWTPRITSNLKVTYILIYIYIIYLYTLCSVSGWGFWSSKNHFPAFACFCKVFWFFSVTPQTGGVELTWRLLLDVQVGENQFAWSWLWASDLKWNEVDRAKRNMGKQGPPLERLEEPKGSEGWGLIRYIRIYIYHYIYHEYTYKHTCIYILLCITCNL